MANTARNLATAAAAAALLFVATPATAESMRPVVIRVCYIDPPTPGQLQSFQAAQKHASEIYAAIGVSLVWADGPAAGTDVNAVRLTAHVVSSDRARRLLKDSPNLSKWVLGVAPLNTARVYLFWDRIVDRARNGNVLVERVLGRVLAHEIGHHLLPEQGHSADGLMRATLEYKHVALPRFEDTQIESIRTLLVAAN